MSYENAKANLKQFGKELNLEGLQFDENHTCILGIDNTFSLHITYEPHSDRLYLYSPILDGLPKDLETKVKLYEALLEGSMLGGQMAGGGVGVAINEELILMHCYIEMGIGADASALQRFAPYFVEAVERWRKRSQEIKARQEPQSFTPGPGSGLRPPGGPGFGPGPTGGPPGGPHGGPRGGGTPPSGPSLPGKPGQPFTKV